MRTKLLVAGAMPVLVSLIAAAAASATTPAQLVLPQGTAFGIIGHSCGGIQENGYASGFDPATGDPQGAVYMKTSCGGSGRGGGYHTTTYSAWASVTWTFDGTVVTDTVLASAPVIDPAFTATDAHGDTLANTNGQAYVTALVTAAPTSVNAVQSGGQYLVSWVADPTAPSGLIDSSTITATPVGSSAATVTATVNGSTPQGLVGPLQPNTTYAVTVTNNDAAGPSAASAPVTITTGAGTLKPGRPTGLTASWSGDTEAGSTLTISWSAGAPGDSPTDSYGVRATSFGGGVHAGTVAGTTFTDSFTADAGVTWRIQVRAHDQAGWGPWSAALTVPGNGNA